MAQLKETVLIAPSPNLNQASASSAQPSWHRPTAPPDTIVYVRSSSITDTAGTICAWEKRFAELEADIYVARSADGGFTWAVPVRVNDDTTSKYQFWPAIAVSNSARHVAWYHFRNSPYPGDPEATNNVLDVFYVYTNSSGVSYPAFSPNVTDTDVGHQPNCPMLGGGTVGFHGDYIELDAHYDGVNHVVHVA